MSIPTVDIKGISVRQASDELHIVAGRDPGYICKKVMHMMTREEILSIDQYCQKHKMNYRERLDELDIPFWQFYKAKRKYRLEDEHPEGAGEFVQMVT